MSRRPLPLSPLLQADPATLPKYRQDKSGKHGDSTKWREPSGFIEYIKEVDPGPPPFGWRDITPYFGGLPQSLGPYKKLAAKFGYYVCMQTVIHKGSKYRRVAAVLAPHSPGKRIFK